MTRTSTSTSTVFVTGSLDAVAARMPAHAEVGGATVTVAPITAAPDRRRYEGTWSGHGGGEAALELSKVSPTACQLDVALTSSDGGRRPWRRSAGRCHAPAAAVAADIACRLEQRTPVPAASRHGGSKPLARIAVPSGALLGLSAVLATTVLAPPKPVTLDVATARYRESIAATAPPTVSEVDAGRRRPDPQLGSPTSQPTPAGRAARRRARVPVAVPVRTADNEAGEKRARAERASATAKPAPANRKATGARETPRLPDPGVYRYATDGWEELDVPRGHRRFPDESTQTIVHTDCGYRVRWDPMEERWDETSLCAHDGRMQPAEFHTHRSFFGRSVEQHFTCHPTRAPKGAVWAVRCRSEDTTMINVARPLGSRTMIVDGDRLEVGGLRIDAELQGANTGRRRADMWHARETGLLVRTEVSARLEVAGPFGRVRYREQYTLHLASQKAHR